MIKRALVILLLLLIAATSAMSQFPESETRDALCLAMGMKSKTADAICKLYQDFEKLSQYYTYAAKYKSDLENGKTPQKINFLLGNTKPNFKEVTASLKFPENYSFIVAETFESVSFTTYATLNHQKKRAILLQLNDLYEQRQSHIAQLKEASKGLERFVPLVNTTIDATRDIADILWEAYQYSGGGLTEFSSVFGYNAFDLYTKTVPMLQDVRALLIRENDKIKSIVADETQIANRNKASLILLLKEHIEGINLDIQSLQEAKLEMDLAAKYYSAKRDVLNTDLEAYQKRVRENKAQYDELKRKRDAIADKVREVETLKVDFERAQTRYEERTYIGCLNGKPYEECTHQNAKAAYDSDKRRLKIRAERILENKRQKEAEHEAQLTPFNRRYGNFSAELATLQGLKKVLDQRKEELDKKSQTLFDDYLKNGQQTSTLEALREQSEQSLFDLLDSQQEN